MIIETNIRAIRVILLIWKWLLFYLILSIAVTVLHTFYKINLAIPSSEISMLGIALSILMGFRVSSAYERWWEARKIWGSVVNNSRSLARQLITFTHESAISQELVYALVYRQIAFVHSMACRLREQDAAALIKPLLYEEEYEQLIRKSHIPNLLLLHNVYAIKELRQEGIITDIELLRLEETVYQLTDNLGGAERIKNTPFPVPYSYFTWLLVHIFAILIPFGMVDAFGYMTIPAAMCAIFIFLIIEQIAIEIQDPFSNRENDIPVTTISQNIEIDLKEMLGDTNLPQKKKPEGGILM
ncbi:bestrophin family protein [Pedobacter sp. SYSU D00535]|uniref:bestrophin family protein n=1 Tax=Pedobacter sp. SYSU D00535 TaxID=2810308 RepID=UPI001A95977C|nr:bestrophin family protein [Pedobacter sp. SYSU D00535]